MPSTSLMVDLKANHNVQGVTLCAVFLSLSLISTLARLASRTSKSDGLKADEALLIVSWISACGETVMIACSTRYARAGWHILALNRKQLIAFQKTFYASPFLQTTSLATAKLSLLVFLRRIFVTPRFRATVWILGAIVIAWWIAVFFACAFVCFPSASMWTPNLRGTCVNQEILDYVSPVPWLFTDFAILISPIPVIKNLGLSRSRKIDLCAIFLMGGVTCILGVVRYRTVFYSVYDVTWDIVPLADWSIIEMNVTIICVALIACKPAVTMIASSRLFSTLGSLWSRAHSRNSSRVSESSSQNPSSLGPSASSAQIHEPSSILPLYNHPRKDGAS